MPGTPVALSPLPLAVARPALIARSIRALAAAPVAVATVAPLATVMAGARPTLVAVAALALMSRSILALNPALDADARPAGALVLVTVVTDGWRATLEADARLALTAIVLPAERPVPVAVAAAIVGWIVTLGASALPLAVARLAGKATVLPG